VISVSEKVPPSNIFICNEQQAWEFFKINPVSSGETLPAFEKLSWEGRDLKI
jgi:hypothetical protein